MDKFIINNLYKSYLLIIFIFLIIMPAAQAQQTYRLSKAPFYKTFDKKAKLTPESRIAHLPFQIDKMTKEELFYQGHVKALQHILVTFDQYLDSLNWTSPITIETLPATGAPKMFVGSSESVIAPPSAEMLRDEFDKFPPMVMHIDKPDKKWKWALKQKMITTNSDYALILWIGFNEYPKANKGLFKKKVVLGTDFEPEIRFLSGELEPVEVLQISGMLLDINGNIIRSGAEAFIYEDSPFWVQIFGASTSIDNNTLRKLISEIKRDDLSGQPLAWKVALDNLLQQLLLRPNIW